MTLTRAEAEQIAKEALEQGWEGDKNMVPDGQGGEFNEGRGRVDIQDWDDINAYRREHDRGVITDKDGTALTGCAVEMVFPVWDHPEYYIMSTDEWRKLRAKVDELREILKQAGERGWPVGSGVRKQGKLGMTIEVTPPGTKSYLPKHSGQEGAGRPSEASGRPYEATRLITRGNGHSDRAGRYAPAGDLCAVAPWSDT